MSDDEYNPDSFDWGDPAGGIPVTEFDVDIMQAAVSAALDVHDKQFSWAYMARADVNPSKLKLFRATVMVPETDAHGNRLREILENIWTCYTFVWDTAHQQHDHPFGHTMRELAELDMVGDSGEKAIDLFGTPSRNSKYQRRTITLYTLKSARDYLRYQNLTALCLEFDMEMLCDPKSELGKIMKIVCTHSIYYLQMADIARIVNTDGRRRLSALIHRHPETHGFLNYGEQEYWVSTEGVVTQKNVLTGQTYTHPSMEALFHQESATTAFGGVAWTIRTAGVDSYVVEFVAAPNSSCAEYVPLKKLKQHTRETITSRDVTVHKFLGWSWIVSKKNGRTVALDDVDMFNRLRNFVALKPRTPKLRTLCANLALRLNNKEDIIAIHGGEHHDIPAAMLGEYVEAALYFDAEREYRVAIAHWKDNKDMVKALNAYYESGSIPLDLEKLCSVTSTVADAVAKIARGSAAAVTDEFAFAFASSHKYKRVLVSGKNLAGVPEYSFDSEVPFHGVSGPVPKAKGKMAKLGPSYVPW